MQNNQRHLTPKALLIILVLSIAVAAFPSITMHKIDARLSENPPNNGIVAFELAGSAEKDRALIDGWGPELSMMARESIRLDFIFIPAYAFLFFSITMLVSLLFSGAPGAWIRGAAFAPFISGAADVVENICMLTVLKSPHNISGLYPRIAAWCATVKFGLLGVVVLVWVAAILFWFVKRLVRKASGTSA
jgi:hypothetical protein